MLYMVNRSQPYTHVFITHTFKMYTSSNTGFVGYQEMGTMPEFSPSAFWRAMVVACEKWVGGDGGGG